MSTAVTELDVSVPNAARSYDHLLGGLESVSADRCMLDRLAIAHREAGAASPSELAVRNRFWLKLAVSQAVHAGIRQFVDLGAGFPGPPVRVPMGKPLRPLHAEARAGHPDVRFACVDHDRVVTSHGQASLSGEDARWARYLTADLGDVPSVRALAAEKAGVAWGRKTMIVLGMVLHYYPPGEAKRIIDGYLAGLAPGSRVAVTVPWWRDPGLSERVREIYVPRRLYSHDPAQVEELFRGLSVLSPGVRAAWMPGEVIRDGEPACVLAATGLV